MLVLIFRLKVKLQSCDESEMVSLGYNYLSDLEAVFSELVVCQSVLTSTDSALNVGTFAKVHW
jgi:hypothetical protein